MQLSATLLRGEALYHEVIEECALRAKRSIWIATANLKDLYIVRPGLRRRYEPFLITLAEMAERGLEIRILHADNPSRAFRQTFDKIARQQGARIQLKICPRVHLKTVIVDGTKLYLGSANFTGAGLGLRGINKRNFELGVITEDFHWLDQVQSYYEELWSGSPCAACELRSICPDPGGYAANLVPIPRSGAPTKKRSRKKRLEKVNARTAL